MVLVGFIVGPIHDMFALFFDHSKVFKNSLVTDHAVPELISDSN